MSDWIAWKGGPCPFAAATPVDLKWRDGDCEINQLAGEHQWEHNGGDEDIVAYRRMGPASVELMRGAGWSDEEVAAHYARDRRRRARVIWKRRGRRAGEKAG